MKLVRLAPLLTLLLTGCGAVGAIGVPLGGGAATAPPADFNVVQPTAPVETTVLPPIDDTTPPPPTTPITPMPGPLPPPDGLGQPDQMAALATTTNITVGFDDLIGGWTISLPGVTCNQFFLSGTPWEQGFRSTTRACSSTVLSSISSWRLDGQEVTLFAGGTPIARLYAVSILRDGALVVNARFEGQVLAGGAPVVFFR